MADNGNETNPGGIWGGLDDFLDFLTTARDAAFESWATYNLFTGENNYTGGVNYDDVTGSNGGGGSWSNPNGVDANSLLLYGGLAVAGAAVIYMLARK
ncbi:MAG: hypothetical protein ACFB13_21225 [Kiloniellaceae bacterium]